MTKEEKEKPFRLLERIAYALEQMAIQGTIEIPFSDLEGEWNVATQY